MRLLTYPYGFVCLLLIGRLTEGAPNILTPFIFSQSKYPSFEQPDGCSTCPPIAVTCPSVVCPACPALTCPSLTCPKTEVVCNDCSTNLTCPIAECKCGDLTPTLQCQKLEVVCQQCQKASLTCGDCVRNNQCPDVECQCNSSIDVVCPKISLSCGDCPHVDCGDQTCPVCASTSLTCGACSQELVCPSCECNCKREDTEFQICPKVELDCGGCDCPMNVDCDFHTKNDQRPQTQIQQQKIVIIASEPICHHHRHPIIRRTTTTTTTTTTTSSATNSRMRQLTENPETYHHHHSHDDDDDRSEFCKRGFHPLYFHAEICNTTDSTSGNVTCPSTTDVITIIAAIGLTAKPGSECYNPGAAPIPFPGVDLTGTVGLFCDGKTGSCTIDIPTLLPTFAGSLVEVIYTCGSLHFHTIGVGTTLGDLFPGKTIEDVLGSWLSPAFMGVPVGQTPFGSQTIATFLGGW